MLHHLSKSWEEETVSSSLPLWRLHHFLPCIFENFPEQVLVRFLFIALRLMLAFLF